MERLPVTRTEREDSESGSSFSYCIHIMLVRLYTNLFFHLIYFI